MHRSLLTGIEKNTDARPLRLGSVVDQVGANSRISIEGANGVPTRPAWFKVRLGVGVGVGLATAMRLGGQNPVARLDASGGSSGANA